MHDKNELNNNSGARVKGEALMRLKRIEGQVRGISKLVQSEGYNDNILNQFASVKSALNGVRNLLLKEHISKDIADQLLQDRIAPAERLIKIFSKITQ